MSEPLVGECPFKVGDVVFYRPSDRGRNLGVMDDKLPKIGEAVRIPKIVRGVYLVWEGCDSPGGGLYWTEFSPK